MGTRAERKEDFGFGVVENSIKDAMVLPHYHQNPSSSSSSSSLCYCFAGGSNHSGVHGDPLFSASSNQAYTSSLSDMFCLSGSASVSADPFFSLSSSGEIGRYMNEKASGFSESQFQELERQKNIYKYITSSVPVPVPSELLASFSKNQTNPNSDVVKESSLKLGIASSASNSSGDLEPWRCRRTDGKKWRCSRNVIPDQKYCERHTHKSRPRSRKHVELSTPTRNDTNQIPRPYPPLYTQPETQFPLLSTLPSASSSYEHHRGLRWFMEENDHQLKVGGSKGSNGEGIGFNYDLNFRQKEPLVDQSFGALQGLLSLNQTHVETRRLLDGEQDEAMGSSLSLSMAGAMEEAESSQMGTSQHQWLSQEGPAWLCSTTTPGGPLAEALCLGVSNNPSGCYTSTSTSSCSRTSS